MSINVVNETSFHYFRSLSFPFLFQYFFWIIETKFDITVAVQYRVENSLCVNTTSTQIATNFEVIFEKLLKSEIHVEKIGHNGRLPI